MKKVNRFSSVLSYATLLLVSFACTKADLADNSAETSLATNEKGIQSGVSTLSETTTTSSAVYRINAGGGQLSTTLGQFAADAYRTSAPSSTYSITADIIGTTDNALYQSERYGSSFGYAFPVTNGTYTVKLHFSENYWTAAGKRKFDATIESTKVLDNYDIFAKAGAKTAIAEAFTVNVTDGTLNVNFSALAADGGVDAAKVAAIEVLTSSSTTTTTPTTTPTTDPAPTTTPTTTTPTTSTSGTNVFLYSDFETLTSLNAWGKEAPRADAITLSTSVARKGGSSVRFNFTKADATKGALRSEIKQGVEKESENWFGFSNFLPSDYVKDPIAEVIAQWHNYPDFDLGEGWVSPPLVMGIKNDRYYLTLAWDKDPVTTSGSWDGVKQFDLGPVDRSQWNDWAFHIKWSYGSDGILEVYKNKQKIVSHYGPTSYNDKNYPYFKVGIYKWGWADAQWVNYSPESSRTLYYDEIRKGDRNSSLTAVSPN